MVCAGIDSHMNQSRLNTYTTLVTRTLWRIETELARTPSLNDLAAAEGVSPFHLSRAFTLVAGQPVMAYVRARRLTEAARALVGGRESVLTIALDAGYESPEGFSRAFREMFGVSPKDARDDLPASLQEPIVMEPNALPRPEPRYVDFTGRTLIGRKARFTPETRPKIPALWESTIEETGTRMFGRETFGVCSNFDGDAHDYMVAFDDDGEADGLDRMTLPAGRYAVFEHQGHISSISETWAAIFDQWMPNADEEVTDGPEFEFYAKDFDPNGEGRVSIWIPVKG